MTRTPFAILMFVAVVLLGVRSLEAQHLWTRGVGGVGTASIDGVFGSREWSRAGRHDLLFNVPNSLEARATLFVMNDSRNLYLAVVFEKRTVDPANTSFAIEFDTNNSGVTDDGDDVVVVNAPNNFFDDVRTTAPPCPPNVICGLLDIDLGGTSDGVGAVGSTDHLIVYEMSHPLNSGDKNDIAVARGSEIGFWLSFRIFGQDGSLADTYYIRPSDYRARIGIR